MSRLCKEVLENAIGTYSIKTETVLEEVTLEFLKELKAYRDAEEQGLLVKVECHCKDCVHWSDMVAGATEHVKLCSIGGYMVGKNGYCVYAEQKLAEMKGE